MKNYQWHGERVDVEFGTVRVKENAEKPLMWYNFECNWSLVRNEPIHDITKYAFFPAIRITTKQGNQFIISNHFGIGVNKLIKGGFPDQTHYSFPDDVEFKLGMDLEVSEFSPFKRFNHEKWYNHEQKRNQWQKSMFPKEYAESQELLKLIRK